MSANPRELQVLSYARGFTHWLYRHNGFFEDTLREGFFTELATPRPYPSHRPSYANDGPLAPGDLITIFAADGTGIRCWRGALVPLH